MTDKTHDEKSREEHPRHRNRPEQEAAQGNEGQEQKPEQAKEESSTTWDTGEHSDAPGPFGTGEEQ